MISGINPSVLSVSLMTQVRSLSDGTLSVCVRDENSRSSTFEGINFRSSIELKKVHDDFVVFASSHTQEFNRWQDAFHAFVRQIKV